MKKSLKERTRTTVKASVLPPLRIEIDREKAKDALGAVLEDIKQMKGETIKFGMKEAQRSIRRQQAQAVFVDASLPRVILGLYWLEICSFSKISQFLERVLMEHTEQVYSLRIWTSMYFCFKLEAQTSVMGRVSQHKTHFFNISKSF